MSDGLGGVLVVALAAIVPLVVLMLTSFVKVSVVLALLRNALGTGDAPSSLVVMGISLVLTFFVMAPVAIDMIDAASTPIPVDPYQVPTGPTPTDPTPTDPTPTAPDAGATGTGTGTGTAPATGTATATATRTGTGTGTGTATAPATGTGTATGTATGPGAATASATGTATTATAGTTPTDPAGMVRKPADVEQAIRRLVPANYRDDVDAAGRAMGPLRVFLRKHADDKDRATFVALAGDMGRQTTGDEVWVLAPAFLATELREAFAIAVLIFIPFLVLDLVIGLGLASLGLSTTQPQTLALPLKLLLFVAVDGWRLLLDGLLRGYV